MPEVKPASRSRRSAPADKHLADDEPVLHEPVRRPGVFAIWTKSRTILIDGFREGQATEMRRKGFVRGLPFAEAR